MPPLLPAGSSPSHRLYAERLQLTIWRRSFLCRIPPRQSLSGFCLHIYSVQELNAPRTTLATAGQF